MLYFRHCTIIAKKRGKKRNLFLRVFLSLHINENAAICNLSFKHALHRKKNCAINEFSGIFFFFVISTMRSDVIAIKLIGSLSFIEQYSKSKCKMPLIRGSHVKCHSRTDDFKINR